MVGEGGIFDPIIDGAAEAHQKSKAENRCDVLKLLFHHSYLLATVYNHFITFLAGCQGLRYTVIKNPAGDGGILITILRAER